MAVTDPENHSPSETDASPRAGGPDLATVALLVFFISLIVIVAVLLLLPLLAG